MLVAVLDLCAGIVSENATSHAANRKDAAPEGGVTRLRSITDPNLRGSLVRGSHKGAIAASPDAGVRCGVVCALLPACMPAVGCLHSVVPFCSCRQLCRMLVLACARWVPTLVSAMSGVVNCDFEHAARMARATAAESHTFAHTTPLLPHGQQQQWVPCP